MAASGPRPWKPWVSWVTRGGSAWATLGGSVGATADTRRPAPGRRRTPVPSGARGGRAPPGELLAGKGDQRAADRRDRGRQARPSVLEVRQAGRYERSTYSGGVAATRARGRGGDVSSGAAMLGGPAWRARRDRARRLLDYGPGSRGGLVEAHLHQLQPVVVVVPVVAQELADVEDPDVVERGVARVAR